MFLKLVSAPLRVHYILLLVLYLWTGFRLGYLVSVRSRYILQSICHTSAVLCRQKGTSRQWSSRRIVGIDQMLMLLLIWTSLLVSFSG
ncbi:hypothetical protein EDC04DRAFT_2689264 [Pisolithus marmoratus]|nr:hypothetical protein EDC04DRAFT_2689264 [Pisolithus marmoratus]